MRISCRSYPGLWTPTTEGVVMVPLASHLNSLSGIEGLNWWLLWYTGWRGLGPSPIQILERAKMSLLLMGKSKDRRLNQPVLTTAPAECQLSERLMRAQYTFIPWGGQKATLCWAHYKTLSSIWEGTPIYHWNRHILFTDVCPSWPQYLSTSIWGLRTSSLSIGTPPKLTSE